MSRLRVVARTGLLTVVGHLVAVATQFVAVPIFLKAWGGPLYGHWLTLSAAVAYLSLADVGMQAYVVNRLLQKSTRGDTEGLARDLASTTLLYAMSLGLGAVVLVTLVALAPVGRWFAGSDMHGAARVVMLLLGFQVLASVLGGLAAGLYKVLGRQDLSQAVSVFYRGGLFVVITVLPLVGGGPRAVAGGQLVIALAVLVVMLVDVPRRDARLRLTLRSAELKLALSFLAPSLMFLFISLAQGLTVQGSVLVVSSLAGAAAVVTFATTRTIASVVRQASGLFLNALWPEFTRIEASGDKALLALGHRMLVKVALAVTVPIVACLLFRGDELHALWTSGRAGADPALLRWLLLDQLASAPWLASSLVLAAINRHRGLSVLYLVAGVGIVCLGLVALRFGGLQAMGATIFGVNLAVFGALVPKWTQAQVGSTWRAYAEQIYLPGTLQAGIVIAAAWATSRACPAGIIGIGATTAVALVVGAITGAYVLFSSSERAQMMRGVRALLGRRRPTLVAGIDGGAP